MDPELLTVVFPEDTMGSAEYGISADQTINSSTHTYSASEPESESVSQFPNQRKNRTAAELEAQEDQMRLEFFSRKSLDEVTPEEWAKLNQLQEERIRTQLAEKAATNSNTHQPVFEDMMKLPVGTRIMATNGLQYTEPTLATVVGSRSIQTDSGWLMLPVVKFEGDTKNRTVLPSGIKQVLGPRKLPKTLNTAGTDSPAFNTWFGDSVALPIQTVAQRLSTLVHPRTRTSQDSVT